MKLYELIEADVVYTFGRDSVRPLERFIHRRNVMGLYVDRWKAEEERFRLEEEERKQRSWHLPDYIYFIKEVEAID